MTETIGTTQTSLGLTSNATTSLQTYYFTRFVSDTLTGISSITAQTWTYNFITSEASGSANFPCSGTAPVRVTAYVWRPSTQTKVGNILDGNSGNTVEGTPPSFRTHNPTFTGSLVSSVSDGDVICFEVIFESTQALANAYANAFGYDGTTVTQTENSTVTSHASFIETPQTLTFGTGANNYTAVLPTETTSISEAIARQLVVSRPLAIETVASSESLARQAINSRPLTAETIAVSESLTKQYVGNRALSLETVTIGEASQRVITNSRSLTETVPITESVTTVVTVQPVQYVRALPTETITIGETSTRTINLNRLQATETVSVGETLTSLKSLVRTLTTETVTVGESIARTLNLSRALIASTTVVGVSLDGVNDYINCGDYSDLWSGSLTKFSFSLWLYNNGAITTSALILDHNSNNAQSFVVYNSTVGTAITFRIVQNNLTQVNCTASGLPSLVDRWVHVVGTYDSTLGTQNIKLYIDSVRTGNQPNLTETIASSGLLTLSGAVNDHKGLMKDFRFWNAKALTQTEVNDVYNSSGSAPTANYWIKLDEGTGSPVDFISASKTAILTNGATWQTSAAGEIVPISESLQRVYGVVRTLPTETVSIGETVARAFNGIRLLPTETVTVTAGTLARVYSAIRSLSDTTVISETLARLATNIRALATETIAVTSGTLARILGASRQIAAQTVVISETIARLFTGQRLLATQTTAISDSVVTLYTPAPPAGTFERQMPLENVAITESLNRVVTNSRALSPETITASESLGRVYGVSRLLATQTTAISESLVRAYGSARAIPAEVVNVLDISLSRLYGASRAITAETIPITETISRAYNTVRALAPENVSISDSVATLITTGANAFVRVLVETISIAESLARVFNGSRELVETVTISDHLEIPAAPVPVPLPIRVGPPKVETVTPKRQRRIAKDLQPYPEPRAPHIRTSDKDESQIPETSMLNMMNGPVKNFFGNIIGMFRKKRDPDLEL